MSRHRARSIAVAALAVVTAALALAGSATAGGEVTVRVDRERVGTELGGKFDFRTTIANHSSAKTPALVAHLNVLSLRDGVYVDPEDWSSKRTWYLGSVRAGESKTIVWKLQAVNAGSFAAYVAVLPERDPQKPPLTGRTVVVSVADRRTINSGGILPLVLGIPCAIGLLATGVRMKRRRA